MRLLENFKILEALVLKQKNLSVIVFPIGMCECFCQNLMTGRRVMVVVMVVLLLLFMVVLYFEVLQFLASM